MARPLRIFPRPTPLTGWAIIMLSGAVMVLDLIEFGDGLLPSGGHTPLWLVAGIASLVGGPVLVGSMYP